MHLARTGKKKLILQKSASNPMSSFVLIEYNLELSHILQTIVRFSSFLVILYVIQADLSISLPVTTYMFSNIFTFIEKANDVCKPN